MATKTQARPRREFGSLRKVQPSERWQASYPNPHDKSRRVNAPTTFPTARLGEAWLAEERGLIERGTWKSSERRARESVTLAEYGRSWVETHTLAPNSRDLYRSRLEDQVYPFLGNRMLGDITKADIRIWFQSRKKVAAKRSLECAYTALRSMMSTAQEDDLISTNPCTLKKVFSSKPQRPSRSVTAGELTAITKCMRPGYAPAVLLAGWCGLRWGEVTGLRRMDVNVANGEVHVYEQVVVLRSSRKEVGVTDGIRKGKTHGKANIQRADVKTTGSRRVVYMPPHIIPEIIKHLESQVGSTGGALLFPSIREANRPVSASTFFPWFKAALNAAGVQDMRFHELRHTAATLAMQTGRASGFDVMAMLGHTSTKTAARYQHVTEERLRNLARSLSVMASEADQ